MMHSKKGITLLAILCLVAVPLFARMDNPGFIPAPLAQNRLMTIVTDEPAWFWMNWWVDVGNVSDVGIGNTLQGGVFPRDPSDEHEYRGLPAKVIYSSSLNGRQFEYPKGSEQFYGWAFGLWVGDSFPAKVTGGDTTWSPNVSKTAFYTDLGAMAAPEMSNAGGMFDISNRGMYFSDMTIPDGYGFSGVGGRLFAEPGTTPLDYQTLWPFADTSINVRRAKIGMPLIDPAKGDIISMQDTYACGGDWIPSKDAAILWIRTLGGPYDVWGDGIRIEQRTYAWNYEYNDSYVFFNYKIQNMNDFPLKGVYLSWFMDNDIGDIGGQGSPGDQGAWDDLIGFDQNLNMGYTYDSDGSEESWVTPAGYIGAVLLETPNNIGLTGFETWQNGHEIDDDGQDSLKYVYMSSKDFVTWENPNDVRMLLNCGPLPELKPFVSGDPSTELNFTIVCIVAYTMDELKKKAEAAKIQFENGYFGYAPPPNPLLNVIPGDSTVYLTWSSEPEKYIDPMSKQTTFEGYRVYKSLTGLSADWQLMADYDLMSSFNADTAVAFHSIGTSKAGISFEGLHTGITNYSRVGFTNNTYTITFTDDLHFLVYDIADQKPLSYNPEALLEGGYCVLDGVNSSDAIDAPVEVKASGDVVFYGDSGTTVPKGTEVSTDPAWNPVVRFKTTANATLPDTGALKVNVEALEAGIIGNVAARQINILVSSVSGIDSVINTAAFTNGRDGELSPTYYDSMVVFIDGSQYLLYDGEYNPDEPGAPLAPRAGDQFSITTYTREELGGQTGIRHFYIDEDVENGQRYYYTVTSYSRPQPTENVGSLEGGKTGQTYWAIPRANPLGWRKASVDPARRVAGTGNALVVDSVINPDLVTGHEYEVGFKADPEAQSEAVAFAYFKDVDSNYIVLDNYKVRSGELSGPIIDGVLVQVAAVSVDTLDVETQLDSLETGWLEKPSGTNLDWVIDWPGEPGPVPVSRDYLITVVKNGQDTTGKPCPVSVTLYNNPSQKPAYIWQGKDSTDLWDADTIITPASKLVIYKSLPRDQAFTLTFNDTISDPTKKKLILPEPGDEFLIKTLKPTTTDDRFRYQTYVVGTDDTTRTLDDIRVVPNPYYISEQWDRSRFDQHVYFQNLPMKCTIRIFNSAGLLIRALAHDGTGLYGSAGSEAWDLRTEEDLDCTNGLYIWQVETEDGERATGKFAIVR